MGANMARRLKDQGFHVTALYDAHRPAATTLAQELGSFASQSLGEVTASADVIITVVSDDTAMREIFAAPNDNLLVNAPGKLFINCATISPEVHLEVEELARKVGAQTLEACMASSITQAREGSLYLMCGGEKSAFERAEPILQALGKTIRYIGKSGEAAKVKALVNMVMNINTAGLAEGLGLGDALGLDLDDVARSFQRNGRRLARPADGWRRHAESRSRLLLFRRARRQGQRNSAPPCGKSGPAASARARHKSAIRPDGRGGTGRARQIRRRGADLQRPRREEGLTRATLSCHPEPAERGEGPRRSSRRCGQNGVPRTLARSPLRPPADRDDKS